MANPFVHVELATTDLDKAKAFYRALFDWRLNDVEMGGGMTYTLIRVGDGTEAGASRWLTTVLRVAGTLDQAALDQLRPVLLLLALSCDIVILDLSAATVASPPAVARGLLPPAAELDRAGRCLLLRGASPELITELSRARVPAVTLADDPVSR